MSHVTPSHSCTVYKSCLTSGSVHTNSQGVCDHMYMYVDHYFLLENVEHCGGEPELADAGISCH